MTTNYRMPGAAVAVALIALALPYTTTPLAADDSIDGAQAGTSVTVVSDANVESPFGTRGTVAGSIVPVTPGKSYTVSVNFQQAPAGATQYVQFYTWSMQSGGWQSRALYSSAKARGPVRMKVGNTEKMLVTSWSSAGAPGDPAATAITPTAEEVAQWPVTQINEAGKTGVLIALKGRVGAATVTVTTPASRKTSAGKTAKKSAVKKAAKH